MARKSASVMARMLNHGIGGRVMRLFPYLSHWSSFILPIESLILVA